MRLDKVYGLLEYYHAQMALECPESPVEVGAMSTLRILEGTSLLGWVVKNGFIRHLKNLTVCCKRSDQKSPNPFYHPRLVHWPSSMPSVVGYTAAYFDLNDNEDMRSSKQSVVLSESLKLN